MEEGKLILPEYPGQYEFMVGSAPEGQVRLSITHTVLQGNQNFKNYSLNITVAQFKEKLQLSVGTDPAYMKLELKDKGNLVATLDNDAALLSSYNPQNGMEIHIIDTDPNSTIAGLTDTSKGDKYMMPQDEYEKRANSVRKLKEQELQSKLKIGDRVDVLPEDKDPSGPIRKGVVSYVGNVDGTKGVWAGVTLDEAQGKNDGSAKGKVYFTCQPNHGVFVRPEKVQVTSGQTQPSTTSTPDEI
eukprot:TRINITY_DN19413_c0_g1_i1.p1 TRINITY_DN19413_c0_g1~~TRINITY_DN19413_c0_g1_i1.p1  ORF type:complete len:243 (+),score=53.41 TRINITY_DN19413_c0_g1_i1:97-825(+)